MFEKIKTYNEKLLCVNFFINKFVTDRQNMIFISYHLCYPQFVVSINNFIKIQLV